MGECLTPTMARIPLPAKDQLREVQEEPLQDLGHGRGVFLETQQTLIFSDVYMDLFNVHSKNHRAYKSLGADDINLYQPEGHVTTGVAGLVGEVGDDSGLKSKSLNKMFGTHDFWVNQLDRLQHHGWNWKYWNSEAHLEFTSNLLIDVSNVTISCFCSGVIFPISLSPKPISAIWASRALEPESDGPPGWCSVEPASPGDAAGEPHGAGS